MLRGGDGDDNNSTIGSPYGGTFWGRPLRRCRQRPARWRRGQRLSRWWRR
ncbi:MAG: hypothetical protein M0C28_06735 [Candidatus Moduliflexus flocculans]|nr:hypothetical protein [Candidatus Moduliflexus flocculans]